MKRGAVHFFRLNIAKKMLLGYFFYAALTILIAFFILSRLERLNTINNIIIQRDIPLAEITNKMIDTLLAQEVYGRRSIILGSPEMSTLFWERSKEFGYLIQQLGALPEAKDIPIAFLTELHTEHNHLFQRAFENLKNPSPHLARKNDQAIKDRQEKLIQALKKISWDARQGQKEKSLLTFSIGRSTFRVTAILCVAGILLGIATAMFITRNISGPIQQLKISTQEISAGKFDRLPQVRNRDELGELSLAFQEMAQRLKHLEAMHLDASPLTRLPGGVAIENVVKKRLGDNLSLAFCLLDLANFKSFNDRYGYARGNEVIVATAQLIRRTVDEHGREEDFVGHIGGDDFVLVTVPERYEKICSEIVATFDKIILDFYDPQDRQRGQILGKTRQGKEISFPLMTLSIAVVTNQLRKLENYIQVGEIAAELKNYAKSFPKSMYVVDRRRG
ncbi:MAG: sensor domain-containing diguanylate cyclase [Deltaproteobacteria bacterium]|nr:sensor domain-containing diguanylate cyclase [Deltaproteobacteria bacterium]